MRIFQFLILLLALLFCCCDDVEYNDDASFDHTFEYFDGSDFDIGLDFDYRLLEGLAINFKLSEEEKIAVRFLRRALTDPMIAKDVPNVSTYSDDEFYEFLFILNAARTKEAVSDIVMTLRVRDEILEIIRADSKIYDFKDRLISKEKEYLKNLKVACSSDRGYEGTYLSLISSDNSFIFGALRNQIYYDFMNVNFSLGKLDQT
ncbi:BTA121 domain-containing protein surface lipoprotein [Borrelia miyamotoi]|uniref:BTA121 domain-containing protein surface lipoprotein n=1 Tax=Borrelia miyamotoi TaxID=47466 RepID=UPI001F083FF4|nr:hypothetical protein [Borrelia miyamotoi]